MINFYGVGGAGGGGGGGGGLLGVQGFRVSGFRVPGKDSIRVWRCEGSACFKFFVL